MLKCPLASVRSSLISRPRRAVPLRTILGDRLDVALEPFDVDPVHRRHLCPPLLPAWTKAFKETSAPTTKIAVAR